MEIDTVPNTKFLGVIVDQKLNSNLHINYVKTKMPKSI